MQFTEGRGIFSTIGDAIPSVYRDLSDSGGASPRWGPTSPLFSDFEWETTVPGYSAFGPSWLGGRDLSSEYSGESKEPESMHSILQEGRELPNEHDLRDKGKSLDGDDRASRKRSIWTSHSTDHEGEAKGLYHLFYRNKDCFECSGEVGPFGHYSIDDGPLRGGPRMGSKKDPHPARGDGIGEDEFGETSPAEIAVLQACGHVEVIPNRGARGDHPRRHDLPAHTEGGSNSSCGHCGRIGYPLSQHMRLHSSGKPENCDYEFGIRSGI